MKKDPVQKEVLGIVCGFLVIFLLVSLLSFSPEDPSLNHAGGAGTIHNVFGFLGAHLAGFLIGLFGMGAFWIPLLLLLYTLRLFQGRDCRSAPLHIFGALLLILTTGALFSFQGPEFQILQRRFLSGGMLCLPLQATLVAYTNGAGGAIILGSLWMVGFLLATGLSLVAAAQKVSFWLAGMKETLQAHHAARKALPPEPKKRPSPPTASPEPPPAKASAAPVGPAGEDDIQIRIMTPRPEPPPAKAKTETPAAAAEGFQLPFPDFLEDPQERGEGVSDEHLRMQSQLLESKLEDFGVKGKVVAVTPGPVITTFEYAPAPGVKINKIVNLTDDLSLALRALSIRIVAPIPGKAAIGIEIPNAERETVRLKEIIQSGAFERSKSKLTLCLGKDIVGNPVAAELDRMPHLLIAGATGAGKSVALNAMICSLLYKATPEEVRLIMVDPKRIELSNYNGIPHLVTPVVTDAKKATNALYWAVREMEARYQLLSEKGARNITQYNLKIDKERREHKGAAEGGPEELPEKLPFIVIIIDELADLMMVASRDVEVALTRLAQMARAAGLHLVLATQRPSVDVLTGIIKANFPTRLTFQVSSKTDSRTIIDTNGAEKLLGNGDMLFLPPGTGRLQRIHGAYISEDELSRVIDFWKEQQPPEYDDSVTEAAAEEKSANGEGEEYDEKYDEAVALVTKTRQASISMIQRHLRIGYNRAARIIETMEREGVVGPSDGVNKREVLARGYDDMG